MNSGQVEPAPTIEGLTALVEMLMSSQLLTNEQLSNLGDTTEDPTFQGLIPQGYSLDFLYPFDIQTGFEWEMTPPYAAPGAYAGLLGPGEEFPPIGPDTPHARETDVPIMRGYTLRDEIGKYLAIAPGSDEQKELAEILWDHNFYSDGTRYDEILRPRHIDSAFRMGIEWGARQGLSVWDMGEGAGREETTDVPLTEASIFWTADQAAKTSFGRDATASEKQMALTISRALEAAGVPVSRSDIAAELEAGAPEDAKRRDMSTTLHYLMRALAGRGAG